MLKQLKSPQNHRRLKQAKTQSRNNSVNQRKGSALTLRPTHQLGAEKAPDHLVYLRERFNQIVNEYES